MEQILCISLRLKTSSNVYDGSLLRCHTSSEFNSIKTLLVDNLFGVLFHKGMDMVFDVWPNLLN